MARLQVLHLPAADSATVSSWGDGRPATSPFALVLDEVTAEQAETLAGFDPRSVGAVAVLVFEFPVEVV